jgi:hypothetical protein
MKILFKKDGKYFGGDGQEATDVEVSEFLASLEPTETSSAVEELTAGLAAGVSEELENAKDDLEVLIYATGKDDFSSAFIAIEDLRKNLETQDRYILDLITISGADSQETAKIAIAKSIGELKQTKVELEKAKADTKVLEDFITELQEAAKVATPADIKAVLEAKAETAKAKKA